MDKVKIHKEICEKMHETYKAKNADYGDSFAKVREEYPETICTHLMWRIERLKTLYKGAEQQVKDESIDDTLLDIANYAVMELVERRRDKDNGKMRCKNCPFKNDKIALIAIIGGYIPYKKCIGCEFNIVKSKKGSKPIFLNKRFNVKK